MNKPWNVGPREKLPRGSFLYIQVGHRIYAGEEVVIATIQEAIHESAEDHKGRRRSWQRGGDLSKGRDYWKFFKRTRDRDKVPGYMEKYKGPWWTGPEIVRDKKVVTGEREIKLCDDIKDAKRFRTWAQAQSACERVEAMYVGFDIKVTIKESPQ